MPRELSPFDAMQAAVDAVQGSTHATNKIGACLVTAARHSITGVNFWPSAIERAFGRDARIGNSSGTVHAEMAALFAANTSGMATEGGALYITDPPCPNCTKNLAEAGIRSVYIDHKGFEKDFYARRRTDFETLSLSIFAHAGVAVHTVFRKDKREQILQAGFSPAPNALTPVQIEPASKDMPFAKTYERAKRAFADAPFCTARGASASGQIVDLCAAPTPALGYRADEPDVLSVKYTIILQPLMRVMMAAVRTGLKIQDGHVHSSRIPTARELVNFVGAGYTALSIEDQTKARDIYGPQALEALQRAGVLKAL